MSAVETPHFFVELPGRPSKREERESGVLRTEYMYEEEPFGLFAVVLEQLDVDLFTAAGGEQLRDLARKRCLDRWVGKTEAVLEDEARDWGILGVSGWELALRLELESPAAHFASLVAFPHGNVGCVLELTMLGPWSEAFEQQVREVQDSLRISPSKLD